MIRLSPFTNFTDAEAQMTLGMSMENGVKANKFYQLDLELSQISAPH
jgi:inward rectifier potassium channel